MKNIRKLLAITLTSIVMASILWISGLAFPSESHKAHLIKEHNLEEIVRLINDSGVNKDALTLALAEDYPMIVYYLIKFVECLAIVGIYHIFLKIFRKRQIPNIQKSSAKTT